MTYVGSMRTALGSRAAWGSTIGGDSTVQPLSVQSARAIHAKVNFIGNNSLVITSNPTAYRWM